MRTVALQRDLRRAGCVERRTSGSGSGTRKPTGGNTGRASRADFHHNFLTLPGSVDDMLAEARGFRLGLVLAHQDLAQLPAETAAALSANARSKVFFNVDPSDARDLSRHTKPELEEHDLSHLDIYTAAARLLVGNRELPAFTFTTNPPPPIVGEATSIREAVAAAHTRPSKDEPAMQQVTREALRKQMSDPDRKGRRSFGSSPGSSPEFSPGPVAETSTVRARDGRLTAP